MFSVDSFRQNGKCLWSVEQICYFREGKGARFIISAFSRYKDFKISDLTQSNSSVPNPNHFWAALFSLGPGSAVGEKGENRGQVGKTSASRAVYLSARFARHFFFFLTNADFFSFFS